MEVCIFGNDKRQSVMNFRIMAIGIAVMSLASVWKGYGNPVFLLLLAAVMVGCLIKGAPTTFSRIYEEGEGSEKKESCEAAVSWDSKKKSDPVFEVYTAVFTDPESGLPEQRTCEISLDGKERGFSNLRYAGKEPVEAYLTPGRFFTLYRQENRYGEGVVMSLPGKKSQWILIEIWWNEVNGAARMNKGMLLRTSLEMGDGREEPFFMVIGPFCDFYLGGAKDSRKYEVCMLNALIPFDEIPVDVHCKIYDEKMNLQGTGRLIEKCQSSALDF